MTRTAVAVEEKRMESGVRHRVGEQFDTESERTENATLKLH